MLIDTGCGLLDLPSIVRRFTDKPLSLIHISIQDVLLPHDAVIAVPRDGGNIAAHGNGYFVEQNYVYTKNFILNPADEGKCVWLEFEGVYQNAMVYIHESFACRLSLIHIFLKPQAHNALHLHFTMDDNPALSEETRRRYYSMYSGIFFQRYILGPVSYTHLDVYKRQGWWTAFSWGSWCCSPASGGRASPP